MEKSELPPYLSKMGPLISPTFAKKLEAAFSSSRSEDVSQSQASTSFDSSSDVAFSLNSKSFTESPSKISNSLFGAFKSNLFGSLKSDNAETFSGSGINHAILQALICSECGQSFSSSDACKRHKLKHKESEFKHICPFCEKRFYRRDALQSHLRKKHKLMI